MKLATILLFTTLFFSAASNAQNPYIGLWRGNFTYVHSDNKIKTIGFQLEFHQIKADTLYGRVISFSDTDSTKVSGVSDSFSAGYKKDDNMFYYFGLADKTEKKKIKGVYVFRFVDSEKQTIVGEFYPEEKKKGNPKVTAKFNRVTSSEQQKSFAVHFQEELRDSKKRNPKYADLKCDDKVYSIVVGYVDDPAKDKMLPMPPGEYSYGQTIREMSTLHPKATIVKIHRDALPFNSVAMAKGFNNILYAVTSAYTEKREPVYAYNPSTGKGTYSRWFLPSPATEGTWRGKWLSGGTDSRGNIYFMTETGDKLVKIDMVTEEMSLIWESCPLGKVSDNFNNNPLLRYDRTIGNFCFDEKDNILLVSNANGTIAKIDITDGPTVVDLFKIVGLPLTDFLGVGFNYGDILVQNDGQGKNRTYVTGRYEIFEIDLISRTLVGAVAEFHNADLAGCNVFNKKTIVPPPTIPEVKIDSTRPTVVVDTPQIKFEKPSILNIVFVQSQDKFINEQAAKAEIDTWIEKLEINPAMTIKVIGHTDSVGDAKKNKTLSLERATKVKSYMISKGIQTDRIVVEGHGGAKPIFPNTSPENMAKNRRVEIDILSK